MPEPPERAVTVEDVAKKIVADWRRYRAVVTYDQLEKDIAAALAAQAQRDAEAVGRLEALARENYALHEETVRALAAAEQEIARLKARLSENGHYAG